MTYVNIGLDADHQPEIDSETWPIRITLDESAVLVVHASSRLPLAAWLRTFASNLAAHADAVDEWRRQSDADLAAARDYLAALAPAPNPDDAEGKG